MPTIEITVDGETGATNMKIKGVRGKACVPLHQAVSDDLKKVLGVVELSAEDTDEMKQVPTVSNKPTVTAR